MALPQIIILNGCSHSGKTNIAKLLQEKLQQQYLYFSLDSILHGLPASDLSQMQRGETITRAGYDWPTLLRGYHYCLPALLQAGCQLIIENAWCERNQKRELLTELAGYSIAMVGVYCDLDIALARQAACDGHAIGVAGQIPLVHQDMTYDLTINTSGIEPQTLADKLYSDIHSQSIWRGAIDTLEHLNMQS